MADVIRDIDVIKTWTLSSTLNFTRFFFKQLYKRKFVVGRHHIRIAEALDRALQAENSDYQAKRQGGIFLDRLEVIAARRGVFDRWLASTGKLGGQRKIPRLANARRFIDTLLRLKSADTQKSYDNV